MRSRSWSLSVALFVLMSILAPASALAQVSASPSPPPPPSTGVSPSFGVATLPPNGTWVTTVSADELLAAGAEAGTWGAGTQRWDWQDGMATWRDDFTEGGFSECRATYAVVGDVVRFTYTSGTDCLAEVDDIRWTLDDAGLHVTLVATEFGVPNTTAAMWGTHPWILLTASPTPSASAPGG